MQHRTAIISKKKQELFVGCSHENDRVGDISEEIKYKGTVCLSPCKNIDNSEHHILIQRIDRARDLLIVEYRKIAAG